MDRRLIYSLLSLAGLLVLPVVILVAQDAAPAHAPDFRAQEKIAPLYFYPLPNAPFSAIANTTWVRTLPDGSTETHQNARAVARDNFGRVFQERRTFRPVPDPQNRQPAVYATQYDDGPKHVTYRCLIASKTCDKFPLALPAVKESPAGLQPDQTTYLTRENLGSDTIEGLDVTHTRETYTFYRASVGNTTNILRTVDYWYSAALQVNIKVIRHDPRDGDQTLWINQIVQTAPDEKWFQVPADYRIIDHASPEPNQ